MDEQDGELSRLIVDASTADGVSSQVSPSMSYVTDRETVYRSGSGHATVAETHLIRSVGSQSQSYTEEHWSSEITSFVALAPPKFIQVIKAYRVLSSDTVSLVVEVASDPPAFFEWFCNERSVLQDRGRFQVAHGINITRLIAQRPEEGVYKCVARNPAGMSTSYGYITVNFDRDLQSSLEDVSETRKATVTIHQAPRFISQVPNLCVTAGSAVVIDVEVDANPPARFSWFVNGKEYRDSTNNVEMFTPSPNRSIVRFSLPIAGEYKVVASNVHGSAMSSGHVDIQKQEVRETGGLVVDISQANMTGSMNTGPRSHTSRHASSLFEQNYTQRSSSVPRGARHVESHVEKANLIDRSTISQTRTEDVEPVPQKPSRGISRRFLPEPPRFLTTLPQQITLNANEKLILSVDVSAVPAAEIMWQVNGFELKCTRNVVLLNEHNKCTLVVHPPVKQGKYKATAVNDVGSDSVVTNVTKLGEDNVEIEEPPGITEAAVTVTSSVHEDDAMSHSSFQTVRKREWIEEEIEEVTVTEDVVVPAEPEKSTEVAEKTNKVVKKQTIASRKLPFAPRIVDSPTTPIRVKSGASVTMKIVVEALPPASFIWTLNSFELKSSKKTKIINEENTSEITFSEGHPGKLSVIARNEKGEARWDGKIVLLYDVSPPRQVQQAERTEEVAEIQETQYSLQEAVIVELMPMSVKRGEMAELTMRVDERKTSPCNFSWFLNGSQLSSMEFVQIFTSEYESVLTIESVSETTSGEFVCVVENEEGQSTHSAALLLMREDDSFEMVPPDLPEESAPKIIEPLHSATFIDGQPMSLRCRITANPSAAIIWSKDDLNVEEWVLNKDVTTQVLEGGVCELLNPECFVEDGGLYKCTATNPHGTAETAAFINVEGVEYQKDREEASMSESVLTDDVHVILPPKFTEQLLAEVDSIKELGYVRLVCTIQSVVPATIFWYRDGEELTESSKYEIFQFSDGAQILTVHDANVNDAGVYTCTAESEHGVSSSSCAVDISPVDVRETDIDDDIEVVEIEVPKQEVTGTTLIEREEEEFKLLIKVADNVASTLVANVFMDAVREAVRKLVENEEDEQAAVDTSNPPHFLTSMDEFSVYENESIKMTTTVAGHPIPFVEWYFGEERMSISEKVSMSYEKGTSSITLKDVVLSQAGTYYCHATNVHGTSVLSMKLVVHPTRNIPPITIHEAEFSSAEVRTAPKPTAEEELRAAAEKISEEFAFNWTQQAVQEMGDMKKAVPPREKSPSPEETQKRLTPTLMGYDEKEQHVCDDQTTVVVHQQPQNCEQVVTVLESNVEQHQLRLTTTPSTPLKFIDFDTILQKPSTSCESIDKSFLAKSNKTANAQHRIVVLQGISNTFHNAITWSLKKVRKLVGDEETKAFADIEVVKQNERNEQVMTIIDNESIVPELLQIAAAANKLKLENVSVALIREGDRAHQELVIEYESSIDEAMPPVNTSHLVYERRPPTGPREHFWTRRSKSQVKEESQVVAVFVEVDANCPDQNVEIIATVNTPFDTSQNAEEPLNTESNYSIASELSAAPQPPKFLRKLIDCHGKVGALVQLKCVISGTPTPEVAWSVDGDPIVPNDEYDIVYEDGVCILRIKETLIEDEGEYCCEAFNSAGRTDTKCFLKLTEEEVSPVTASFNNDLAKVEAFQKFVETAETAVKVTELVQTDMLKATIKEPPIKKKSIATSTTNLMFSNQKTDARMEAFSTILEPPEEFQESFCSSASWDLIFANPFSQSEPEKISQEKSSLYEPRTPLLPQKLFYKGQEISVNSIDTTKNDEESNKKVIETCLQFNTEVEVSNGKTAMKGNANSSPSKTEFIMVDKMREIERIAQQVEDELKTLKGSTHIDNFGSVSSIEEAIFRISDQIVMQKPISEAQAQASEELLRTTLADMILNHSTNSSQQFSKPIASLKKKLADIENSLLEDQEVTEILADQKNCLRRRAKRVKRVPSAHSMRITPITTNIQEKLSQLHKMTLEREEETVEHAENDLCDVHRLFVRINEEICVISDLCKKKMTKEGADAVIHVMNSVLQHISSIISVLNVAQNIEPHAVETTVWYRFEVRTEEEEIIGIVDVEPEADLSALTPIIESEEVPELAPTPQLRNKMEEKEEAVFQENPPIAPPRRRKTPSMEPSIEKKELLQSVAPIAPPRRHRAFSTEQKRGEENSRDEPVQKEVECVLSTQFGRLDVSFSNFLEEEDSAYGLVDAHNELGLEYVIADDISSVQMFCEESDYATDTERSALLCGTVQIFNRASPAYSEFGQAESVSADIKTENVEDVVVNVELHSVPSLTSLSSISLKTFNLPTDDVSYKEEGRRTLITPTEEVSQEVSIVPKSFSDETLDVVLEEKELSQMVGSSFVDFDYNRANSANTIRETDILSDESMTHELESSQTFETFTMRREGQRRRVTGIVVYTLYYTLAANVAADNTFDVDIVQEPQKYSLSIKVVEDTIDFTSLTITSDTEDVTLDEKIMSADTLLSTSNDDLSEATTRTGITVSIVARSLKDGIYASLEEIAWGEVTMSLEAIQTSMEEESKQSSVQFNVTVSETNLEENKSLKSQMSFKSSQTSVSELDNTVSSNTISIPSYVIKLASTATITCELNNYLPQNCTIDWYCGKERIEDVGGQFDRISHDLLEVLIIRYVEPQHGDLYSLKINDDVFPVAYLIVENSADNEAQILTRPQTQFVMEGQPTVITCVVDNPDATVTWVKDKRPLRTTPRILIEHDGDGTHRIVFTTAQISDQGTYVAMTSSHSVAITMVVEELIDEKEVTVIASGTESEEEDVQEYLVPPGSTATIACELEECEQQRAIRWLRDGKDIVFCSGKAEHVQNGLKHYLVIHDAASTDSGLYSVCISNVEFRVAHLCVNTGEESDETVVPCGVIATIQCQTSDVHEKITWAKDGVVLELGGRFEARTSADGHHHELVIHDVQPSDAAVYSILIGEILTTVSRITVIESNFLSESIIEEPEVDVSLHVLSAKEQCQFDATQTLRKEHQEEAEGAVIADDRNMEGAPEAAPEAESREIIVQVLKEEPKEAGEAMEAAPMAETSEIDQIIGEKDKLEGRDEEHQMQRPEAEISERRDSVVDRPLESMTEKTQEAAPAVESLEVDQFVNGPIEEEKTIEAAIKVESSEFVIQTRQEAQEAAPEAEVPDIAEEVVREQDQKEMAENEAQVTALRAQVLEVKAQAIKQLEEKEKEQKKAQEAAPEAESSLSTVQEAMEANEEKVEDAQVAAPESQTQEIAVGAIIDHENQEKEEVRCITSEAPVVEALDVSKNDQTEENRAQEAAPEPQVPELDAQSVNEPEEKREKDIQAAASVSGISLVKVVPDQERIKELDTQAATSPAEAQKLGDHTESKQKQSEEEMEHEQEAAPVTEVPKVSIEEVLGKIEIEVEERQVAAPEIVALPVDGQEVDKTRENEIEKKQVVELETVAPQVNRELDLIVTEEEKIREAASEAEALQIPNQVAEELLSEKVEEALTELTNASLIEKTASTDVSPSSQPKDSGVEVNITVDLTFTKNSEQISSDVIVAEVVDEDGGKFNDRRYIDIIVVKSTVHGSRVNEEITLKCTFTGQPLPAVLWEKNGALLELNSNYTVTTEDGISLLRIENTKIEDTAVFTCTIANDAGYESSACRVNIHDDNLKVQKTMVQVICDRDENDVALDVVVTSPSKIDARFSFPPISRSLAEQPPYFLLPLVDKLYTRTSCAFKCIVMGIPLVLVRWLVDGVDVSDSEDYEIIFEDGVAILRVKHATKEVMTVQCIARNAQGTAKTKCTARRAASATPSDEESRSEAGEKPFFLVPLKDVCTGSTHAVIKCIVGGSPLPSVACSRDNQPFEDGITHEDGVVVIRLSDLTEEGTLISCVAQNETGECSTSCIVKRAKPNPHDSQRPVFVRNLVDKTYDNGEVALKVAVVSYPEAQLTWSQNGVNIVEDDEHSMTCEDGIGILRATGLRGGECRFSCTARNEHGDLETTSDFVQLRVVCEENGFISFSWYCDDIEIVENSEHHKVTAEGIASTLQSSVLGSHKYRCDVSNSFGKVTTECIVSKHSQPHDIKADIVLLKNSQSIYASLGSMIDRNEETSMRAVTETDIPMNVVWKADGRPVHEKN
ncbi:unnamed protein product [Caenorhabditis auriculariae]|uniref:Ig-like domain-containing protein n=1 Tax=Caenorhabditis auriculariae TaxID=2777116 RepID=A0A8S1H070_9PELO|nr:unnamed protein product [Caenorhabditis auriculariae]